MGYQRLDGAAPGADGARAPTRIIAAAVAVASLGLLSSHSTSVSRGSRPVALSRQANAQGGLGSPLGDDLVQHNWPGLQCVMDDDDTWDWGDDNTGVGCLKGDTKTCIDTNFTQTEWDVCGLACNTTDESIYRKYVREYGTTSGMMNVLGGHSFLAVCEWEAVKHLPRLCNGSFVASLPTAASNNLYPNAVDRTNGSVTYNNDQLYFNGTLWDRCNVHAFCWSCADPDGSLNKYCEAVMQKYNWWHTENDGAGSTGHTPSPAKTMVFDNLTEYWCTAPVLDAIETGRYKELLHRGVL